MKENAAEQLNRPLKVGDTTAVHENGTTTGRLPFVV